MAARAWEEDNCTADWFPGARELLDQLRTKGNKLVLVSNISLPAWKTVGRKLAICEPFDKVFLSCKMGLAKPDPKVWQTVESWYPEADQFWMVGDNQVDDLDVPKTMGWQTILVTKDGSNLDQAQSLLEAGR